MLARAQEMLNYVPMWKLSKQAMDFAVDTTQRNILYWDTMRQRGTTYLEHALEGKPPVLDFEYETLMDGSILEDPVNYSLLRIIPKDDCPIDETKRPIVIIDPRAGHGPGVAGTKPESQIGVAMRDGHPVYFVTFKPHPEPGQTLEAIGKAEAMFIEEVKRRHPMDGANPAVVGNCQAGWAVTMLATLRPEIMGPILLNGAPLSYWAGNDETATRYMGGLLGGEWLSTLTLDLGNGQFDGANLVQNFENMNPANTLWTKQYNLYKAIDTEAERYLEFEKWWGGFFFYGEKEYKPIVSELFIGNKLAKGEVTTSEGIKIDLKNIQSPIVVFASWGDNITPPQQALHWIVDAYGHEDAIVSHEQVIVYMLHEEIGHLGIFVSGQVALKEHAEIFNTMEMIDALPPGLYEMIIDHKHSMMLHADLESGDYTVRIERRTVKDISNLSQEDFDDRPFAAVAAISSFNNMLYKNLMSPVVKALSTEFQAKIFRGLHPMRLQRAMFSDLNPALIPLPYLAALTKRTRRPITGTNHFSTVQEDISKSVVNSFNTIRDTRDATCKHLFKLIYGPIGLGAMMDSKDTDEPIPMPTFTESELQEMNSQYEKGGFAEALIRMIIAVKNQDQCIERRSGLLASQLWDEHHKLKNIGFTERQKMIREQARLVYFDVERSIMTLPKLLKKKADRKLAFEMLQHIMLGSPDAASRFNGSIVEKIANIMGIERQDAITH